MDIPKDILVKMYCEEKLSQNQIAKKLNVSQSTVSNKLRLYGIQIKVFWTKEDEEYLIENLGKISFYNIAKNLGKTLHAISSKVTRLGLGGALLSSGKLTPKDLSQVCGVSENFVVKWITEKGLVATRKVLRYKTKYWQIEIDNFWKWAAKNKSIINFSKIEPGILGKEPKWVEKQRKEDSIKIPQKDKKFWTNEEDKKLTLLYSSKYTYSEIGKIMGRSKNSIRARADRLNLPKRVIAIPWKDEEVKILLNMRYKGHTCKEIGYELGREESHVAWKWLKLKNSCAEING